MLTCCSLPFIVQRSVPTAVGILQFCLTVLGASFRALFGTFTLLFTLVTIFCSVLRLKSGKCTCGCVLVCRSAAVCQVLDILAVLRCRELLFQEQNLRPQLPNSQRSRILVDSCLVAYPPRLQFLQHISARHHMDLETSCCSITVTQLRGAKISIRYPGWIHLYVRHHQRILSSCTRMWKEKTQSWPVIGMSFKLFHIGAENWSQKFRRSLSVNDTVVITGHGT